MHAWEAIQKALDYIEENIGDEIDTDKLASVAALSPFYYQRLFSKLVQKPVREYIRLRRLARACKSLGDKSKRILDVALECGFGSHETFTRAFKDAYGMTPEAYRDNPVMLNHFGKPDLLLNYIMIDEGVPLISDGIVLRFDRKRLDAPVCFTGLKGYVPIGGQLPPGEATGIDVPGELWSRFHKVKDAIPRAEDARELGVAYMGDAPEGHFSYFVGAETDGADISGFEGWRLPSGEYAVCGFEAESFEKLVTEALDKAIRYSGLWLEKHGLHTGAFMPELYYKAKADVAYMELWHPIDVNN